MAPPSFPSDHDQDHHCSDHLFFPTTLQASSSSSSSLSVPVFPHDAARDHGGFYNTDPHQLELKQEGGVIVPCNIGSCDNMDSSVENDPPESGLRFTIWKQSESSSCKNNNSDSVKWVSSKMRLVINSDRTAAATQTIDGDRNFQDENQTSSFKRTYNSLNDGGAVIRTCSDCNTTKTPLWRSGPRGPKSLCNACGIRQRKARRAMMAAAEAAAGGIQPTVLKAKKVQHKVMKRAPVTGNLPLKRKCKEGASESRGRKKLRFEGISLSSLSESSAGYERVFPQDEREAAILLMTLSYGLLQG